MCAPPSVPLSFPLSVHPLPLSLPPSLCPSVTPSLATPAQPPGAISLATVAMGSGLHQSLTPAAPTLDLDSDKEVGSSLERGVGGGCRVRTGVPQPGWGWQGVEGERGSLGVGSAGSEIKQALGTH